MTAMAAISSWWEEAACQGADPELFFPVTARGVVMTETELAKAICSCCPIKLRCLEFALRTKQSHGVWGGLDEDERRRYTSRRDAQEARAI
jgi:WhiB family transcriptional regulator, redox-sensing transcriptional regulator